MRRWSPGPCPGQRVPEALVHRVIVRESRYQAPLVGRGGAIGLMQIKLATARGLGYTGTAEGLRDPDTNLTYGGEISRRRLSRRRRRSRSRRPLLRRAAITTPPSASGSSILSKPASRTPSAAAESRCRSDAASCRRREGRPALARTGTALRTEIVMDRISHASLQRCMRPDACSSGVASALTPRLDRPTLGLFRGELRRGAERPHAQVLIRIRPQDPETAVTL